MREKLSTLRRALAAACVISLTNFCPTSAQGAESQSKLESEPRGWVDILPSADLKGWYRVPVPTTGQLGREQWHVDRKKKILICDGDGGHDMLLFNQEIGDAIFHIEFCYTRG